jgi:hypothetical protein
MKSRGHRRANTFATEFEVAVLTCRLPRKARSGLLSLFRRAKTSRPGRVFWILDPDTGEWHVL